jgi:hypothetical protein
MILFKSIAEINLDFLRIKIMVDLQRGEVASGEFRFRRCCRNQKHRKKEEVFYEFVGKT